MPPFEHKPSFDHQIQIEGFDIDLSEYQVPPDEVAHLRERVLNHLDEDGVREEYNEADINWLFHSKPYNIERFLMSSRVTGEDPLVLIQKCLSWRKTVGLSELRDDSFPKEFYEKGGLFRYKEDANGTPLLYMRIKMIRKQTDLDKLLKIFLSYQVSKIDDSCNSLMSWAVVFDCSDIGFSNVHIDMMRFLITILKDYFPAGIRYVLVYDLPWILNAVQKMIFTMIPEEAKKQIFFKTKKNIHTMIPKSNLPDYMGGQFVINHRKPPDTCLPLRELFANDFTRDELDKIQKVIDSI